MLRKYSNYYKVITDCLGKLPNFLKYCILNNIDEDSVKVVNNLFLIFPYKDFSF